MDRLEKTLIYVAIALMAIFACLVLYAGVGLGISLPTSHEHSSPFTRGEIIAKENNEFEVYFVARMWAFDPPEVVLPEKAEVNIYLSALDVNHGFDVVGTNLNLMAVPGVVNMAHHRFDRSGEYPVICHEYCGLNHHKMLGMIRVVNSEEYLRWKEQLAGNVSMGEKISMERDCAACHSTDGTEDIAPTFKGLYGRTTKLTDGTEVIVDEEYLIESIQTPNKKIVAGYEPDMMPEDPLSDEELRQIIDYIKTLK